MVTHETGSFEFTSEERNMMIDWHGGQSSMMYAVASTGSLSIGSEGFREGRTNFVWLYDLMDQLATELNYPPLREDKEYNAPYTSALNRVNQWLESNEAMYEEWMEENS